MVGSWPCKVSSEIHINGRQVSEPVREDAGKTMAPEPVDNRDPKRAHVVLSKGHEVVGMGYSRVTDVAGAANSGNHDRVIRVSKTEQHYRARLTRLAKIATRTGKQIGLVGLAWLLGLAQTAAWIDE
jgi:hypothetical protein